MRTTEIKPDVLAVDDDRGVDEYLKDFYIKMGHRFLMATNADKAIRIAEQNRGRPTVALVDISLARQMNGIELISHFTYYAPHVISYVITGSSDEELHRKAKWAGAVDVFVKPLNQDDLCRAVQSYLVDRCATAQLNDSLTGLQTKRVFTDVANGQIVAASRHGRALSLVFVDVDDFKTINNTHGHNFGDKALEKIGGIIRGQVRVYDHPCRWGGDEFAILLPGVKEADAKRISCDIKKAVGEASLVTDSGETILLSVSAGVAILQDGDNLSTLVDRADKAMYKDKSGEPVKA